MELITRTVYGAKIQTCQLLGIPNELEEYTTLNEKFNVATSHILNPSDEQKMRYVAIGNGGHKMEVSGNSSLPVPKPQMHRPTDAALYSHLPFILRPAANDIDASTRINYALRKNMVVDGDEYFAYYLRRMDFTGVEAQMLLKNIENNIETTTPFIPTAGNLSPIPPEISTGSVVPTTGDFVLASAPISFILNEFDMDEIKNAANIIYGSEDYAIISELGLVAGVDKVVSATDYLGASFNYNEVIGAQICTHISTFHAVRFSNGGINSNFDVGATEPLYLP